MNALLIWFRGRTVREQRLLMVMVALLVITLVFAGIIRPVRDGLESTRQRHASAEIRLGEVKAQVAQVKAIQRARPRVPEGPLADAIRTRADEAGFVVANLEPDGDRIRITIATARPGPLLGWIAGLEADGLLVDASTINGNGDGTVSATLTLRGRAP
jgi:general secretion pathway protein M